MIARGEVTREQLREIHDKMEMMLGQAGVYVDAIYLLFAPPVQRLSGGSAGIEDR